jgi:hypothetical protein
MKIDVSARNVGPTSRHHSARLRFRIVAGATIVRILLELFRRESGLVEYARDGGERWSCIERALHFVAQVRQAEYSVALLCRHDSLTHSHGSHCFLVANLAFLRCAPLRTRLQRCVALCARARDSARQSATRTCRRSANARCMLACHRCAACTCACATWRVVCCQPAWREMRRAKVGQE